MVKNIFFIFFLLFHSLVLAVKSDHTQLNKEISKLNDLYKYENSIIILEEIINSKSSTAYDRYNAYLQKALTYKRIYNYPEVLENLDYALKQSINTDFYEEAEVRILTERMFVEFDSRRFEEARKLMDILALKNTNLLDADSHGFYLNAVAVLYIIDKNYERAKTTLDEAIYLLEKNDPQHLPMIYTKVIALAEHLKDKEMAMKAFEKGMVYADQYKIDIYRKSLYNAMSHFFVTLEDYKNAYLYETQAMEISSRYNASFQNGKLALLEKNIIEKRKNMELEYEKKKSYLLAFSSILLLVILIVTIKLYQSKKEKNILIGRENDRIRTELNNLINSEKKESEINLGEYDFTTRQFDIINLVKQGKTNKEIGALLFISENTVKYHLKTIYNILGIDNRLDLK